MISKFCYIFSKKVLKYEKFYTLFTKIWTLSKGNKNISSVNFSNLPQTKLKTTTANKKGTKKQQISFIYYIRMHNKYHEIKNTFYRT